MALEVTGRLHEKYNTQQITPTFSKREFVLEISEQAANGMTYTNYAAFQLVNAQCAMLDNFNLGDQVKVSFNIRGNRWEKDGQVRYITNLNAWRIEHPGQQMGAAPQGGYQAPNMNQGNGGFQAPAQPSFGQNDFGNNAGGGDDDLPF